MKTITMLATAAVLLLTIGYSRPGLARDEKEAAKPAGGLHEITRCAPHVAPEGYETIAPAHSGRMIHAYPPTARIFFVMLA